LFSLDLLPRRLIELKKVGIVRVFYIPVRL
jgi:hypothetical protein